MKLTPHTISINGYKNIQESCPLNTFRVYDPGQIPPILPSELVNKSIKVIVAASGDIHNAVYMVNCLRVDQKDFAIDQQPLIIAYSDRNLTAGIIQHGDWSGRTIYPPPSFFNAITSSGIMQYYPYVGIPNKSQGAFDELTPDSHREAFWSGVRMIK
ncbi:hypothetical protein KKC91_06410 [bacterium]|nr:hypothetical protein [bacterium]